MSRDPFAAKGGPYPRGTTRTLFAAIDYASNQPDIDLAYAAMQNALGQTDGGVASIATSDIANTIWATFTVKERAHRCREYIRTEMALHEASDFSTYEIRIFPMKTVGEDEYGFADNEDDAEFYDVMVSQANTKTGEVVAVEEFESIESAESAEGIATLLSLKYPGATR